MNPAKLFVTQIPDALKRFWYYTPWPKTEGIRLGTIRVCDCHIMSLRKHLATPDDINITRDAPVLQFKEWVLKLNDLKVTVDIATCEFCPSVHWMCGDLETLILIAQRVK